MEKCGSRCLITGTIDNLTTRRLMVAEAKNEKFSEGTIHPQCKDCQKEELAQIETAMDDLAINDKELSVKWKELNQKAARLKKS